MERDRVLFVIGDAVGSKRDSAGTAEWLRALAVDLNGAYGEACVAAWEFTRGDEVRGMLRPDSDPLAVVLRSALAEAARPMRWALAWGEVDRDGVEATAADRTGPAVLAAERMVGEAKRRRVRLVVDTGDTDANAILEGIAPAFMDMLAKLTPTQRHVARLAIIDGLRQSEVAARLKVRRATISVSFARARVASIEGLAGAIRKLCARLPVEREGQPLD